MWIIQLATRKLIDIKSSTYNPSIFCSLHSPCIKQKGESKNDNQQNILFANYSIVCVWRFLDSKTPIMYIFYINRVYKFPGNASSLYFNNKTIIVGTKEGTLQLFDLREDNSLYVNEDFEYKYDNESTGVHKTYIRKTGYKELGLFVRDPSFTTEYTNSILSEIVSICHIPIDKSYNQDVSNTDDNLLFQIAVLDINGNISIYNAIKTPVDMYYIIIFRKPATGLRYGSTIKLLEIMTIPNELKEGLSKCMSVCDDFDNKLYCCMGILGSISKKDIGLLSSTNTKTIFSSGSTIFNPPYDTLSEGEYITFNHSNNHLALVAWSGGWVWYI